MGDGQQNETLQLQVLPTDEGRDNEKDEEEDELDSEEEELILKYDYEFTEFHASWLQDTRDFLHTEKIDDDTYLSMEGEAEKLEPEQFEEFIEELSKDEVVTTLNLRGMKLTDPEKKGDDISGNDRMRAIFRAIEQNPGALMAVDFSKNYLGYHSWRSLGTFCDFLKRSKLQAIDISSNHLLTPGRRVYNGMLLLGEAISQMPLLRKLRVSDNNLDAECCKVLMDSLLGRALDPSAIQLEALDLSNNPLLYDFHGCRDDTGFTPLCNALRFMTSLTALNLSDLRADYIACLDVLGSLDQLTNLKLFTFERNELEVPGAKELARQLDSNKCWRYLRISGSQIQDEGAIAILKGLKANETLQYLDLSANGLTSEIHIPVQDMGMDNISVMDICFDDNDIEASELDLFQELVHVNHEFNRLREDPATFNIDEVPPATYDTIFHKLERLSERELKALKRNPLFMDREDLRNHLLLLCPPTRDELVQQAMHRKMIKQEQSAK